VYVRTQFGGFRQKLYQGGNKPSEFLIITLIFEITAFTQDDHKVNDDREAVSELSKLLNLYFGTDHISDLYHDINRDGNRDEKGDGSRVYYLDFRRVMNKKGGDFACYYIYIEKENGEEFKYVRMDPENVPESIKSAYLPLWGED